VNGDAPAAHCLAVLQAHADPIAYPLLQALLSDTNSLETPTTLIQQVHTLGSRHFAATYRQPAPIERESYLQRFDTPLLSEPSKAALRRWAESPAHRYAVFTARPTIPSLDGVTEDAGYAPEGELAVGLLGLDDVPLIGSGQMVWLARRYGRSPVEYIKPYPVQALAAIGAAASGVMIDALHAAARLFEHGELSGPLAALSGLPTRVIVFEDSTGGIRATRLAVERLRAAGLRVEVEAFGVSPEAPKQAALAQVADRVVDEVNTALAAIL
jgi:hypothetical protein